MLPIKLKKLRNDAILPEYKTPGAAGMDITFQGESVVLLPGEVFLYGTGFAISIENPFVAMQIIPRSGMGHKEGVVLGNSTGLLDSDYQGEVFISIWNRNKGKEVVLVPGERIAQIFFTPVIQVQFVEVLEFVATERGEGGFGSTGR